MTCVIEPIKPSNTDYGNGRTMRQLFCLALAAGLFLTPGIPIMADQPAIDPTTDVYQSLSIEYSGGPYKHERFEYRLMAPANMQPGTKYPLILFLHGAGERGDDNVSQLKYLPHELAKSQMRSKYPCFVLAPQCRKEKRWVEVAWDEVETASWPEHPSDQMQVAMAALKQTMANASIDASRIYLAGLSMGGFGSWDLATDHPDWFAAALIVCGGGEHNRAQRLTGLPIWVFHGDADTVVPVQRSRSMVQAIKDAGGQQIRYTELPGVGHNSWDHAFDDQTGALKWLFEQKRSEPAKLVD